MPVITCVQDLRALARRRIPRAIFDYADGGACSELTIGRNRRDLDAIELRQRVMVDLSSLSVESALLGQPAAMPLGIGPTGLTGLFYGNGEIHGARAAQTFGVPFCLSTMSICSIEDVRAAVKAPFWFQVYVMRDRGFNEELIARGILDAEDARAACAAGVDAIVVSNHGGRQLDGAPSTISVLAEVVAAVDGRCEVLFDGGGQCGQDILKAVALGARGCLIGKTFLYALAAMGGRGGTTALTILRDELRVTLALTGRSRIADVDTSILRPR